MARAKSVGPHRFDKYAARVATIDAAMDPGGKKEREQFLEFLDQQVVFWYRAHSGRIHVVTGALLRALTATGDSARVLEMHGEHVDLIVKHPGMYYQPHVVAPHINLAEALRKALQQFRAWKARQ